MLPREREREREKVRTHTTEIRCNNTNNIQGLKPSPIIKIKLRGRAPRGVAVLAATTSVAIRTTATSPACSSKW
jgi:hypothetical protein